MINSVEITRVINEAKDGVDNSAFGPLFVVTADNIADKKMNNLAWAVYGMVLQAMLQEVIRGDKDKT